MNPIVSETLSKLMNCCEVTDFDDTNRHKLIVKQNSGYSAYYFSVPIRNADNNAGIAVFHDSINGIFMRGTNCNVVIKNSIKILGSGAEFNVDIPSRRDWHLAEQCVVCGETKIMPTLNGVCIRNPIRRGEMFELKISTDTTYEEIRCSSKSFAFMKQRFVPNFSVSPIGVYGDQALGPLLLSANKGQLDGEYLLTFTSPDTDGEMCVEFNAHEQKLIQDTTVESARPDENNAYGASAFVGYSDTFGAQQLYLKFNYPVLGDLGKEHISNVKLYLPVIGGSMIPLEALHMDSRFCSFGSAWNKRVKPGGKHLPIEFHNNFCCIDLSEVMIDRSGRLKFSNGVHLRPCQGSAEYCVFATGDSHLFPPILEVRVNAN